MNEQDATQQAPLIPSDRVEELAQFIKDHSAVPMFALKINVDRTPGLTDTKLGGLPYWPKDRDYPTTNKGTKLMLLAQLNLDDFGKNDRLPDHGLLQFFIDSEDDCSGMDFDDGTNQNGFRVIWHETIDPTINEDDVRALELPTSFDPLDDFLGNPLYGEYALDVTETTSWVSPASYEFDKFFFECCKQLLGDEYLVGRDDWYDCLSNPDSDKFFDIFNIPTPQHQVFGYPFFTQTDPRDYIESLRDLDTLLLQIDSEGGKDGDRVLWGDVGIGGFFINGDALRRSDFSRVLFNWDCY